MYTFHVAANCGGHRKDSPGKCTPVLRDVPLDNDTAAPPHNKNKVSVIQMHSHARGGAPVQAAKVEIMGSIAL